jgi:2,4-diaminopentanoate dehydrogenase
MTGDGFYIRYTAGFPRSVDDEHIMVHHLKMMKKPRIIIVGAGRHGCEAAVIAHDLGWNIVAVLNRLGEKIGRDAGILSAHGAPIGITVADIDSVDLAAFKADIAIVAMTDRLATNLPVYQRLLSAGINVLCHGSEAYFPQLTNPEAAAQIQQMALANGVTFTGTGVWDHSRIWAGILAASPCGELIHLVHRSRTRIDVHPYIDLVGIGLDQATFRSTITEQPGPLGGIYRTIPSLVMHGLGHTVSRVAERREPVLFDQPVYCAGLGRDLMPGEVAGTRIVVEVETVEGPSATAHIELRVFREGEVDNMAWEIAGDPASDILMTRHDSLRTSTMVLIHRCRDVIDAEPGIRLITELGPLDSRLVRKQAMEAKNQ